MKCACGKDQDAELERTQKAFCALEQAIKEVIPPLQGGMIEERYFEILANPDKDRD